MQGGDDLVDDPVVDYERLWYIELSGGGNKIPARSWGGYDQDYTEADNVYTHEDVEHHPADEWGIVGVEDGDHRSHALLIFDLDEYKAPDEFDRDRVTVPSDTLVTQSQNGGHHVFLTVDAVRGEMKESDFDVHEDLPFDIDIRGSLVSHHVVAPADIPGVGGQYTIVNDEPIKNELTVESACKKVKLDGEPAIEYNPGRDIPVGDGDGYTPDADDEWLFEDDIRDALNHVSADLPYDQWRDVVFAVADYYARIEGGTQKRAVEAAVEWSKTAPDAYDDDTERHVWNIVESGFESVAAAGNPAEREDDVTLGTLLSIACANGWEMPNKQVRLAAQRIDDFIDGYAPIEARDDDDHPTKNEKQKLATAVANLPEEEYEARVDEIVTRVAAQRETIDRHRDLANDHEYGDLVNQNGQLVRVTLKKSGWMFTKPVLSFEFDVDSILNLPDDEGRSSIVRIDPPADTEPEFELDVPPETFNDVRTFKSRVLSKVYSTTIEDDRSQGDVMDSIRHWIAEQDVPVRDAQYEMGLNEDGTEFVTPAGSIIGDGWTDDPDAVHIERGNQTNATVRQFSADPDEHDDIDTDEVAEMIELLAKSRTAERITPLMAWFYAAPHRPRIFDVTATFNPMAVTGRSGSGKTATLAALNQMWGMGTEPQSAEASKHAMLTGFASSKGIPVWFDEYRPEKMPGYVVDRFHSFYKKSATGGVEPRGNTSMGTDDWHLRSPVVVSGESEIRSNAERRRTVNVTVTKKPTQAGPEKQAFKNLVGDVTTDDNGTVQFPDANYDLQQHAVAYYSWVASMSEDEFRDAWFDAREKVAELLNKWGDAVALGDTEIQALQTVVFGHQQMLAFAGAMGADLSELPGEGALEDALAHVADVDGDGRQPHEHQFFSLVSRAAAADYLEADTDYRVVHEGQPNENLRVNVTRAFDKVSKFARDHDLNEDLLNSAADYKGRFEQLEAEDTFVTTTRQPTQGIARCTGIDMDAAVDEIAGFARGSFVDVDDADEDGETVYDDSDSDGDGDGPTPINEIGQGNFNYEHVTVKVVEWEETPAEVSDAGGPVVAGSVVDSSGRCDVVWFGDGPAAEPDGYEHMEAGETVRIEGVRADEYDGANQLILDVGATITSIQPGVGWTECEVPEDGQATVDDVPDGAESQQESVLTDGGDSDGGGDQLIDPEFLDGDEEIVDVRKHVIEVVQGLDEGTSEEDVIELLKTGSPIRQSNCRQVVEKLKHAGRLYESGGALKAVSGGE